MEILLSKLEKKHTERLLNDIHLYQYRYNRYGLEYAMIALYLKEPLDLKPYSALVRLTDSFIELEDNFYVIVYEGANREKSLKSAQNIIKHFQREYPDKLLYVSGVTATEGANKNAMITLLFQRLGKSMKEAGALTVVVE